MKTLELCVSCWQYDRILCHWLSALVRFHPVRYQLIATVCYCPEDTKTSGVIRYFQTAWPTLNLNPVMFERRNLMRRAISRNDVSQITTADFLLYGDVDYCFAVGPDGTSALDTAGDQMVAATRDWPALMWPRHIMSSRSHEDGDAEIEKVGDVPQLVSLDHSRFELTKLSRAIGGAQWITGDWARRHGYLPDSKRFQRPADRWCRTFEDQAFRQSCGLPQVPLNVPGIYRIRHSKRGRRDVGCRL